MKTDQVWNSGPGAPAEPLLASLENPPLIVQQGHASNYISAVINVTKEDVSST